MTIPDPPPSRYWQNWDRGRAARLIDEYWTGDPQEAAWRDTLCRSFADLLGAGGSVLEAGCGSGLVYEALLRHGIVREDSYTGGDVSAGMLEIARRRFPRARFLPMDLLALPCADRSYDAVVCIDVLQHLPTYDAALRELARVARKTLVIASWFTPAPEDQPVFSAPCAQFDGQRFHENRYSLPRFLTRVFSLGRELHGVRVRRHAERNYTVCLSFEPGGA